MIVRLKRWLLDRLGAMEYAEVELHVEQKVEQRVRELFAVHKHGEEIGAWKAWNTIDMLERARAELAQAAIDGNPLAADILNKSFKKMDAEANIDMGEWGRS